MISLSRRGFLRAVPALPIAARATAATAVAEQISARSAMALAGLSAGTPDVGYWAGQCLQDPRIYALYRAGLLPDFVRSEVREQAERDGRCIPPDVVGLRSVSLSTKYRMSVDQAERRLYEAALEVLPMREAKRVFFSGGAQGTA